MKILVNAIHTKTGGGLTYLKGILPYLIKEKNIDISVLCSKDTARKIEVEGAHFLTFGVPSSFWILHLFEQIWLPIYVVFKRFDAVLCNANYVPLLAPNALPILHSSPAMIKKDSSFKSKAYWAILTVLTQLSLHRAPRAFAVSHEVADYFAAMQKNPKKIEIAYPAPPQNCRPVELENRDKNMILAVGDIYPQKNYSLLIKAMANLKSFLPQAKLVVLGKPVDVQEDARLKALIHQHSLVGSVEFLGAAPHDNVLEYMGKCRIFINLSQVESFNITVVEALACGAPTVLSDLEIYKNEVAETAAFYMPEAVMGMPPERMVGISLAAVMQDVDLLSKLSERGPHQAAKFSWAKAAKVLIKGLR